MNNIIFGIIAIIVASICYYHSWRFHQKDQYRSAIALMILGSLCLYFYVSVDFFLHLWDERFHALVAKNLINHPFTPTLYDNPILPFDYRDWSANHIWVHKQPLTLWALAGSMWLFGVNEIALRLPSIVLVSIAIYLVFSVGSYLFNKKTGYFAAFLFSINGLIVALMGGRIATDHVDIFFMFFILLSIYLSIQYIKHEKTIFSFFVGISIGLAILSKWLPALIVLPIWLLLVWDSEKFSLGSTLVNFVIILLTLTAVFLPWQLYIFSAFPEESIWESSYNFKHLYEVIEGNEGSIFYYLNRIRITYGEYIYLPLIWFFWKVFRDIRDLRQMAVVVWFVVPFLFFSLVKTKMQAYLLFTAPALFYMTAGFFFSLAEYKRNHRFEWVFNIVLALFILLPLRYSFERMHVFQQRDRNPQWVVDLRKLNRVPIENGILFNYSRPLEAMFYTDLVVYPYVPNTETVSDLSLQGYTLLINDNGRLPNHIKDLKNVKKVNLTEAIED